MLNNQCFFTHINTEGGTALKKKYDIAIIGGGTAGLTAAIYCCRAGKKTVIIEKSAYGGQIISSSEVANYPAFSPSTGYNFAAELYDQVKELNVDFISDNVTGIVSQTPYRIKLLSLEYESGWLESECVIIATGTESRQLGLANEKKYTGHGLSYCAVCDGAFHKGKTVAVIGGGSTALEEALYLSFLCEKVHIIQRSSAFTAEQSLAEDVSKKENIEIHFNTTVTALYGNDRLERIKIMSEGTSFELRINGLFVAIGRIPQNRNFDNLIALDKDGYIIAGDNCHTSIPGIFAAGDCRTKELRQLVTAASDGAVASLEAIKYLKKN